MPLSRFFFFDDFPEAFPEKSWFCSISTEQEREYDQESIEEGHS